LVSLQQHSLANGSVLTTEADRYFVLRTFEGAHDRILRYSTVTGLRGTNGAACAAIASAS